MFRQDSAQVGEEVGPRRAATAAGPDGGGNLPNGSGIAGKKTHQEIDVPRLFLLWNTPSLSINDVAAAMGLTLNQLRSARERYGLLEKPRADESLERADCDPTPEEIAARAAEVRADWPKWRVDGRRRVVTALYSYDGRQHVFRKSSH